MSFTQLFVKRPSLVVVLFTVLGVLGLISYSKLKYELLPKITIPTITISTIYPGASPNEVQNSITKPIEDAISSLDKVSTVRSTSSEGVSFTIVELTQEADVNQALQDAQRKVNSILSTLPEDAKTPTLDKFAIDEQPIMSLSLTSKIGPREFYQLVKDQIKPQFTRIAGVGQVVILGGEAREVQVNVDEDKLRSYGISLAQVATLVRLHNVELPAGNVKASDAQFTVRLAGKFTTIKELGELVVAHTPSGDVHLTDVAAVQDATVEPKTIARFNGNAAIALTIQKQNDANSVEVSHDVRAALAKIEAQYVKQGLKFDLAYDNTEFTIEAADAVQHDLFLAILLVAGVMLIFLHSLRDSFIVMLALPCSIISTFIAMYLLDYSLNLMTLLALSLVVGILVDDSIVVLENIHRHLEMGKDRRTAAVDGRNEISFTALSITLVDVVVFVPLAFVGGLVGNILGEFAIVVVVSTLLSLLVSFTVTPVLASRLSRVSHPNPRTLGGRFTLWFEKSYNGLRDNYASALSWSLRHKRIVIFATFLLFVGSMMLPALGFIGGTFFEQSDQAVFVVQTELAPSAKLEETNQVALKVERMIGKIPEVRKIFTNVGASSDGFLNSTSNNIAEYTVSLGPLSERKRSTEAVGQEAKRMLSKIPGIKVRVNPVSFTGGGAEETPLQLVLTGTSYEDVQKKAEAVLGITKKVVGTTDVRLSTEQGKSEAKVNIDREKMTSFGLSINDVGQSLRISFTGDNESKYRENSTDYDIRVQLDKFDRSRTEDLANLSFYSPVTKSLIELKQFATIELTTGPTKLERTNRNASVMVRANVISRPVGDVGNEIEAKVKQLDLGTVRYFWLGQMKNSQEGNSSLGISLLTSILFMYLIMVALYDSYVYPFVVLFSIPVAIVGAMLALAMAMKVLSLFSILGLIMLIGLVGKNAILLVDFTNHLRERGMSTFDALVEAGRERLRPILMTTIAMVFGMMPIALNSGAGSEWKQGLAWAIIGGLTSSMLLTLVVVPVVYLSMDISIVWVRKLFGLKTKPMFSPAEVGEPSTPKLVLETTHA